MLTARLTIDPHFTVGAINRRLFGSFVEHLGRCVYDGHLRAGAPDRRRRRLPQRRHRARQRARASRPIRYPGGNFVSGFRWEDSVGPREQRPRRLDLAWHSTETNEVGLHEFADVARQGRQRADARRQPRHPRHAGGARPARVRQHPRRHRARRTSASPTAATEPFDIRMWCLGNEMDGPWQLGPPLRRRLRQARRRRPRRRCASSTPSLELVVCGISSAHMPTFGEWERVVLDAHLRRRRLHLVPRLLRGEGRRPRQLPRLRASTWTTSSSRSSRPPTTSRPCSGSDKTINISFDEWNVWYIDRYHDVDKIDGHRQLAGRPAPARGRLLGRRRRRVRQPADLAAQARRPGHQRARLAQLVNVIAPIMTEPGGAGLAADHVLPVRAHLAAGARGRPRAQARLPTPTTTSAYGTVPVVDAVATHDAETGAAAVFLVNRSAGRGRDDDDRRRPPWGASRSSPRTPSSTRNCTRPIRSTTPSGWASHRTPRPRSPTAS